MQDRARCHYGFAVGVAQHLGQPYTPELLKICSDFKLRKSLELIMALQTLDGYDRALAPTFYFCPFGVHVRCLIFQRSRYERTRCVDWSPDDLLGDPPQPGTEVQVFVRSQAQAPAVRNAGAYGLWHDGIVSSIDATHLTIELSSESMPSRGIQWFAKVGIRQGRRTPRVWRLRTAMPQPEEIVDIALLLDEQGEWVESEAMRSSRFDGQYHYGTMKDPLVELMYSVVRPGGPALQATTLLSESRYGTFNHPKGNEAMRQVVKTIRYLTHI